ncbi:arginine--tRNA ligase [Capsulimonas corticalis]|uniref:Arginine--tRNA ligase n=1 Tax=Capsulimonas corticalis TaxID=2219043 RepID=A0A402D462_9BACT|nr:arginine--tRNA ligase [Capsulimonas corticalis]BDI31142.1 arginine--tRNA ligase [Capsulimonas corticalis]
MIKEQLAATVAAALQKAKDSGDLAPEMVPDVVLEAPKSREHGDWATNVALTLSKSLGLPPQEVAAKIVAHLPIGGGLIEKAEVAGPGFINLTLRPDWLFDVLRRIETEGDAYGRSQAGAGKTVLVEFVSTNPNGPITVAGGRNAAIGDVMASLLDAAGYVVTREYYINDALNSVQMINFGKSVFYRYLELLGDKPPVEGDEPPDWLYQGDYVADIAREIIQVHGREFEGADLDDPQTTQTFRALSQDGMIAQQKADLDAFGVRFDNWFSESSLHDDGRVDAAVKELTARGHTFEKDGALWLRSTEFGDDKDRVLVRANGTATYIAGDAAYHKDKFDRGFDEAINVWGADHAGYVARTKAVVAALGYDPSRISILLYQLVRIVKDGELVRSSKRKGAVLELKSDLIEEIGKDAARIFFLMRSPNTDLDIDLDLAKKTEKDNPVYYIQYAHARIVQTLERAKEQAGASAPSAGDTDLTVLTETTETDLIRKLSEFPEETLGAMRESAPQRLVQYVRDLAAVFHTFYDAGNRNPALRVVTDDPKLLGARLVLIDATRIVFKNAFALLGVSAPERM